MKTPDISIVTPWRDHPEFIAGYQQATEGAERIIIDGGCEDRSPIEAAFGEAFIPEKVSGFAAQCNRGLNLAQGNIIVMLNNDVYAEGDWLSMVREQVKDGALYGPEMSAPSDNGEPLIIHGLMIPYLSAWCIAATKDTWLELGGFSEEYAGGYWEDNDLCFSAIQHGMKLVRTTWPIRHLGNGTSKGLVGAYAHVGRNRTRFQQKVREALCP